MQNIKALHSKFKSLNINPSNQALWQELLYLDQSLFKPLMEEILNGNISIEDTRLILNTRKYNASRLTRNLDRLVSDDNPRLLVSNLLGRLFPNNNDRLIKELPVTIKNIIDYKDLIANEYYQRTGIKLTKQQIDAILPEVETSVMMQLNYDNLVSENPKEDQIRYSNALSKKLNSRIL